MATPVWPADIDDHPMRDDYEPQPMANMESWAVEDGDGFDITGPKAAEALFRMGVTYEMTASQYVRWLTWWRSNTLSGVIPFSLRDPIDRIAYLWRLQSGQQITVRKPHPQLVRVRMPLQRVT